MSEEVLHLTSQLQSAVSSACYSQAYSL